MFDGGGSDLIAEDLPRTRSPGGQRACSLWDIRPIHARKFGHGTDEWMRACSEAFCKAFEEFGESWPTEMKLGTPKRRFMRPR